MYYKKYYFLLNKNRNILIYAIIFVWGDRYEIL